MSLNPLLQYVAAVKAKQRKDAADMIAYAKAVQAAHRRARSGQSVRGLGSFDVGAIDWKQLGVGAVVGVGLGYVLFATK